MSNFLKKVIIKIDFVEFDFKENGMPSEIESIILNKFSIPEPKKVQGKKLQFSGTGEVVDENFEEDEWHYFNSNREKELVITKNALYVTYTKYESFPTLLEDWTVVINALFDINPDLQISRFGLRYINQIPLEENIEEWRDKINNKLLNNFELGLDIDSFSRSFSIISMNNGGIKTHFQYGMHNPDYPSTIKDYSFTLDYDLFYDGPLTRREIIEKTTVFHDNIKRIFKLSIISKDGKR